MEPEPKETEEEPKGTKENVGRDGETPREAPIEVTRVEGDATLPEEIADLPGLTPEPAHLLLQGVYGDFPHHNDRYHLDGGLAGDAAWHHCWGWLAVNSASWYATPSGAVGHRFTEILAAEWPEVLFRSWNSERPLVFAHVVLTKTLGVRRAREIRARITRRMELWKRGQHAGLVEDAEADKEQCHLQWCGGGQCHSAEFSLDSALVEAPPGRPSGNQPGGGKGVSSRGTNARKPGDRLQMSSGRSIRTCVSPPLKTLCAQPLRSMRMYLKQYPSTSRRMTSRGLHQSSPAQQVRWERRGFSCAIGSFASDARQRS